MITFQLDQCLNDKKLARDCTNQGLATAWCFPKRLMHEEDPVVLSDLLARSNPLVTFDLRMAEDHGTSIPQANPGMIVISNGRGNPRTMTTPLARKILGQFKEQFPNWHQTNLNNSIIEISPTGVEVWHVDRGQLIRDDYFHFNESDWVSRLEQLIRINALRLASLPNS